MSKNNGGQAFPVERTFANDRGMSLRDYFAAKELAKVQATSICDIPAAYQRRAEHCYRMADAMLAERAK